MQHRVCSWCHDVGSRTATQAIGNYGEGPNAISFSAGDIQDAKAANQQQLDDLLSRLNQFAKTNATGTLGSETAQFVPPPLESKGQTNASETFDYEKLKTFESGAESGDPLAQVLLAGIYGEGVGAVQKDSAKAAYW